MPGNQQPEEDVIRQSIRLTPRATEVIRGKATDTWPGLKENVTGLINQVIIDWERIRDVPGGPATKVNAKLERHERILQAVCKKLDIDMEDLDNVQP